MSLLVFYVPMVGLLLSALRFSVVSVVLLSQRGSGLSFSPFVSDLRVTEPKPSAASSLLPKTMGQHVPFNQAGVLMSHNCDSRPDRTTAVQVVDI